jgi:hypothetical protein
MQCCNQKRTSKFCPDCGKNIVVQKQNFNDVQQILRSELYVYEIMIDRSWCNKNIKSSGSHDLVKSNHPYHVGSGILQINIMENNRINFFDNSGIGYIVYNPGNITVEKLLVDLTNNKISNPMISRTTELLAESYNGIIIIEYELDDRKRTSVEYLSKQKAMDDILDRIKIDLFLMNGHLYTLEQMHKMFDLENAPFTIDFKNNPIHKIHSINIYTMKPQLVTIYSKIQEKINLISAIESELRVNEHNSNKNIYSYFGLQYNDEPDESESLKQKKNKLRCNYVKNPLFFDFFFTDLL